MVASPTGQVSSGRIVLENEWRAPTGYSDSEDEEVTTETRLPRSLPRRIRAPSDTGSDEGIAPPTKQARASVVAPLGYDEDAHLIGDPEDVVASAAEAASFSRLARRYQLATSWLPGVHRALFAREDDMSRPPALDTGRVDSTKGSLADQGHLDPHRQKSKQMRKKDPARSLPAEEGWQISHSPTHRVEGNLSLQSNEQVAYGTQEATPIQPQQGPVAVKYSELASAIQSDGTQASPEQLFEPHRRATLLSSPPSEEDALASELFKRLDELVERERATADVACAFAPMGCVAGPALVWGRSDLDGTAEAALGVLYSTKSQTRMQSPGGELALATFDCADIAAIEASAHCEATHQHGSLGKALATAKQRTAFFQSLAAQYAARQDEHGEIIVRLMDALYGTSTGSISARHRFSAWLRDCACPRMQPAEEFRTAWHQEHALHPETFHQDGQALDEALFQLSGGCVLDAVRALQHAGNLRLALLISRCVDPQVDVAIDVASQLESWKQDGLSEQSLGSRRLDLLHLLAGQVQRSAGHGLVSRNKSPWFCGPRFSWIRAFALFFWYARPSIIGQAGTLASANSVTRAENQYMQTLNEDDDDEEEDDAAALRALLCDALSTYDAAWQSLSHNQDDTLPNKADAETDSWLLESPPSPPPLPPAQDRAYRYGRLSSDAVFPVSSFDAVYVMLRWYCQAPAFWSPRYQLSPECFGMKCSNALDFRLVWLVWECMRTGALRRIPEDWIDPLLRAQCYEGYARQLEMGGHPLEALYVRATLDRGPGLLAYLLYLWPRMISSRESPCRIESMIGDRSETTTCTDAASSTGPNAFELSSCAAARWLCEYVHLPWSWIQATHYQWLRYRLGESLIGDERVPAFGRSDMERRKWLRFGELSNAMLDVGLRLIGARPVSDKVSTSQSASDTPVDAVTEDKPSGAAMESDDPVMKSTVTASLQHSRAQLAWYANSTTISIQIHLWAAVRLAPLHLLQSGLASIAKWNESLDQWRHRKECTQAWKQVLVALQYWEERHPGSLAVPSPTQAAMLEFSELGGLILDVLALKEQLGTPTTETDGKNPDPFSETPVATLYRRLQLVEQIRGVGFDLNWVEALCLRVQRFAETPYIPFCRETPALMLLIQYFAAIAGRLVCFMVIGSDHSQAEVQVLNRSLALDRARTLVETLPLLNADRHLLHSELEGSSERDVVRNQRWLLRDPLRALRF